jgi:hypothetical protein
MNSYQLWQVDQHICFSQTGICGLCCDWPSCAKHVDGTNQWSLVTGKTGGSQRFQNEFSCVCSSSAWCSFIWAGHPAKAEPRLRGHASVSFHFYCCSPFLNAFSVLSFVLLLCVVCMFIWAHWVSLFRLLWGEFLVKIARLPASVMHVVRGIAVGKVGY